jgi:hypothetical protein
MGTGAQGGTIVSGMPVVGKMVSGEPAAASALLEGSDARDRPERMSWPVAVLTLGALSLGLWAGIWWTIVALV